MEFYNAALQKLRSSLNAQAAFLNHYKNAPDTFETYDKLIVLAASDFVKAYRQRKTGKEVEDND